MTRIGSLLVATLLLGVTLSGCIEEPAPTPTTPSASPSQSATPTVTPTPTPTPTPTITPSPSSDPSNPPPQRVTGVTTIAGGGSGEVEITWTQNPESDIDHYIVYRAATPGGPRARIGTMTPRQVLDFPIAPFVDSEATVYYYRVRAVDTAGQRGPTSVEVCGASIGHTC